VLAHELESARSYAAPYLKEDRMLRQVGGAKKPPRRIARTVSEWSIVANGTPTGLLTFAFRAGLLTRLLKSICFG
jgi:hypothetical protein